MGESSKGLGHNQNGEPKPKSGCATLLFVWLVSASIVGIMLNSINETGQEISSLVLFSVAIGAMVTFAVFCFKMAVVTSRAKKVHEVQRKTKNEERQKHMEALGASLVIQADHMAGLPLGQGAKCDIYLCEEKVVFQKDANTFNLYFDKVLDVTTKTDVEIQKQYVSSVGGAVGGAVLFGPLGAIVGGRAKEKKSKTENTYLIYTYEKDGNVDYISFEVTGNLDQRIKSFVEHFKSLQTGQRVIDL